MKTNNVKQALVALLTIMAFAAPVVWYFTHQPKEVPPPHTLLILDRSGSAKARCEALAGIGKEVFADKGNRPGSTFTVLLTGDAATANEPRELAREEIPFSRRVIEGRKKVLRQKDELLNGLREKCGSIAPASFSPLYLSLARGLQQLKASGCDPMGGCRLVIQTDGEENIEERLHKALKQTTGKVSSDLPPKLDNEGIAVKFCGLSETIGVDDSKPQGKRITRDRNGERIKRLQAVWLSVFTHPELISFAPFCKKVELEQPVANTQPKTP